MLVEPLQNPYRTLIEPSREHVFNIPKAGVISGTKCIYVEAIATGFNTKGDTLEFFQRKAHCAAKERAMFQLSGVHDKALNPKPQILNPEPHNYFFPKP